MKQFVTAILATVAIFTSTTAAEPLLVAHRPEGAKEGTFAIVFRNGGEKTLRNVNISFAGSKVYNLAGESSDGVAAGGLLPVYGRYNKPGKVEVTLLADGVRQNYTFTLPGHAVNRKIERQWAAENRKLNEKLHEAGLMTAEETALLNSRFNQETEQ